LETADELTVFLTNATADGVWNRLLYRGAAWALMREDGVLPANAPPLGPTIDTDLAEHGFSVLRATLALRETSGASDLSSRGFERAANAFEALVPDGRLNASPAEAIWLILRTSTDCAPTSATGWSMRPTATGT
jgi:hypothetical protein